MRNDQIYGVVAKALGEVREDPLHGIRVLLFRQSLISSQRQRLDDASWRGPRHARNTGHVTRASRHFYEPTLRAATGQATCLHSDELRQQAPCVDPHRMIVIAGHDDGRNVGASQPLEESRDGALRLRRGHLALEHIP